MEKIRDLCSRFNEDDKVNLREMEELYDPELEKEDRIASIILRVYNKDPIVFINTRLDNFIHEITVELETEG